MATPTSRVIPVLELFLQHPNTALDAASLCSLLCSSKAVRAAAQQAGGPCTSICVNGNAMSDWQVASPTLTSLTWSLQRDYKSGSVLSGKLAGALASLTNLRQLHLKGDGEREDHYQGELLAPVAALTQLTLLQISSICVSLGQLEQLPASLQQLELPHCYIDDDDDDAGEARVFRLSHLTCLTHFTLVLDCENNGRSSDSWQLPLQLLELTAGCGENSMEPILPRLGGVSALQQLRRLLLCCCFEAQQDLLALTGLSALTDIELRYYEDLIGLQTSAWAQLPQLHSLHVEILNGDFDDGEGFQGVMAGITAAISLRRLHLDLREGAYASDMRPELFGYLTGLRQLQELCVRARHTTPVSTESDAAAIMQLTALTGLTQLKVSAWAAGDVGAAVLACGLPQLRKLKLYYASIESRAALLAIGKLSQLQHPDVRRNAFGDGECLQLLTQLCALTRLDLASKDGKRPTKQQMASFWAAVRGAQQQGAQP
ncbi:hypothetical protein OEZ85_002909 [Tetradesmus obliquus]|uniref:RNI-like protein n=1 Tax=Tetradesmus obliquus TaxID=3088 RepID=A0ABY8TZ43_TETOB|nr:hypothetical protein OEZ85_002909 [Tetradesmus obliquus]